MSGRNVAAVAKEISRELGIEVVSAYENEHDNGTENWVDYDLVVDLRKSFPDREITEVLEEEMEKVFEWDEDPEYASRLAKRVYKNLFFQRQSVVRTLVTYLPEIGVEHKIRLLDFYQEVVPVEEIMSLWFQKMAEHTALANH